MPWGRETPRLFSLFVGFSAKDRFVEAEVRLSAAAQGKKKGGITMSIQKRDPASEKPAIDRILKRWRERLGTWLSERLNPRAKKDGTDRIDPWDMLLL